MKKVPIKGQDYEFIFDNPVKYKDSEWSGLCRKYEKEIVIDKQLRGPEMLMTILHEWGHALMHEVGADDRMSEDMEEFVVENYAKEFYKVLFQVNPFNKLLRELSTNWINKCKKEQKKKKAKNGRK